MYIYLTIIKLIIKNDKMNCFIIVLIILIVYFDIMLIFFLR